MSTDRKPAAAPERELYEASREFRNTVAIMAAALDMQNSAPSWWGLILAASERLHLALLNQHGVAVVADSSQVAPPPALGAHEVHPEAVDAGLDLGKSGERLVAADALEHASGVRQNCDGSATALEVIRIPAGDGLDPITVYADDLGEGRGRLTVCCYSDSWSYTAGWGAMGGSLHSFIADLNPHYLADNLLWPNAAKVRKHQRHYVERIASAVIAAFAVRPQGVE